MKVLHIEDRFHPEMGYQPNFFAKYNDPSNEFIILTSNSLSIWNEANVEDITKYKDKEFETKYNVKIIRTKVRFDRGGKSLIWLVNLKKIISKINPDVIYVHGIELITTARLILSRKITTKYVVVSDTHSLLNQHWDNIIFKLYLWHLKNIIAKRVNKKRITVFYTTQENRYILEKIYGINSENVESCPIGTDFNVYQYDENAGRELKKTLNILPDEIILLYTGKFNKFKQPHIILDAVKSVENKIKTKVHLIFIGAKNQEYFDKYFKYRFENNDIKVLILASVKSSELYKYYSMADFAVFPKENTLSSLDSQACKLPILMEEDETNKERARLGGLLYEKNNLVDLANKIISLINDSSLKKKLSEEGYKYVKENYDYENIVSKMEQVLLNKVELNSNRN